MKSRLLAYTVIILLAGYFYSDYAKASDDLPDPTHYCFTQIEAEIKEHCSKGSLVTVQTPIGVRNLCDWRYQMFQIPNMSSTYCVYRGETRLFDFNRTKINY